MSTMSYRGAYAVINDGPVTETIAYNAVSSPPPTTGGVGSYTIGSYTVDFRIHGEPNRSLSLVDEAVLRQQIRQELYAEIEAAWLEKFTRVESAPAERAIRLRD